MDFAPRKPKMTTARHNVSSISTGFAYLGHMRQMLKILALATCAVPATVFAETFNNVARLDVLPGWQTPTGTHMAGIRLTLAPGWKTYWRAPGDAGIPPQFSWHGSENVAGATFHWPTPEVIDQNDLQAIGYRDGVVLPVEIVPTVPGQPITLSGEVVIGVCEEVCVPVTLPFRAELPPDGGRDGAITAALLNQPIPGNDAGVRATTCTMQPSGQGLQLTATVTMPAMGGAETVVIETTDPQVWVSPSDVTRTGDSLQAIVDMVHVSAGSFAIDRSDVRITVLGADAAVDIKGCTGG